MLDQLDAPFITELQEAWTDCPPVRRMVAAYLQIKPRQKASTDLGELLAMFPTGVIK